MEVLRSGEVILLGKIRDRGCSVSRAFTDNVYVILYFYITKEIHLLKISEY